MIATIEMEDGGIIEIELYPDIAPNTVRNFIALAKQGFYDGLTFHRVIPGFMIQGGCPLGTGGGDPGYYISGEFSENGFENSLKHKTGVISMARLANNCDSAGSQFFITVGPSLWLDGQHAAFGKVISGLEIAQEIAEVAKDENGKVVTCEVVDGFEYKENEYVLVQNPEDGSVYLFKVVGDEENSELVIPEDEEFEEVSSYYQTLGDTEE